jgi:hypothetical protein
MAGFHGALLILVSAARPDEVKGACARALRGPRSLSPRPRNLQRRIFIAFWLEGLVIWAPVCFHKGSNASTEEVHMRIHSSNPMLMSCAAAADHRAPLS